MVLYALKFPNAPCFSSHHRLILDDILPPHIHEFWAARGVIIKRCVKNNKTVSIPKLRGKCNTIEQHRFVDGLNDVDLENVKK